jgi:hypothetical protein
LVGFLDIVSLIAGGADGKSPARRLFSFFVFLASYILIFTSMQGTKGMEGQEVVKACGRVGRTEGSSEAMADRRLFQLHLSGKGERRSLAIARSPKRDQD